jgi:hypothetical protein
MLGFTLRAGPLFNTKRIILYDIYPRAVNALIMFV